MYLYDYRCSKCEQVSQFLLPLGSLDDQTCPYCGAVAKRIFTVFETPPKIGGGACSEDGFGNSTSCHCMDETMESLAAI